MKIAMNVRIYILATILGSALSYELSEDYESNTALEKQNEIWEVISSERGTKGKYPSSFQLMRFVLADDISPSVDHFKDTLPYNHGKRIHSVGGVGKAAWKSIGNHGYTGLFEDETAPAMIRFSLAKDPEENEYIPGIGVKIFRDGIPSANFVAMNSVNGQGNNGNFFEMNFSNHIPPPKGYPQKLLGRKFENVSSPATMVGLSDIASYEQNGFQVSTPIFPYQLRLVPNPELKEQFQNTPKTKLEDMLSSIPSGTKLWDIFVISSPEDSDYVKIAELVSSSEIVHSKAGDEFLFFRHQKMMDDIDLRPEWIKAVSRNDGRLLSGCPGLRRLRELEEDA